MRIRVISGVSLLLFFVSLVHAEGPTFDAASVKITDPNLQQPFFNTGGPGSDDPGHFRAPRMGLFNLLGMAFGVSTDQLSGPAWIRDVGTAKNFTIVATMPADTTREQFQKMLQNLLVERFHLVFHHETRNFPGYELVVDKGGPKFKEVTTAQRDDAAQPDMRLDASAPFGADGFPIRSGPFTSGQSSRNGTQKTKYQERTMTWFVSNLGGVIGNSQGKGVVDGYPQPRVVDKTELTGKYTFILEYYDASLAARMSRLPGKIAQNPEAQSSPAGTASEPDAGGPNIFKAMQSQLGLRLDKTADVPVDMVVVESVDKVPTEN